MVKLAEDSHNTGIGATMGAGLGAVGSAQLLSPLLMKEYYKSHVLSDNFASNLTKFLIDMTPGEPMSQWIPEAAKSVGNQAKNLFKKPFAKVPGVGYAAAALATPALAGLVGGRLGYGLENKLQ